MRTSMFDGVRIDFLFAVGSSALNAGTLKYKPLWTWDLQTTYTRQQQASAPINNLLHAQKAVSFLSK
jgi:hypothetical protein